MPLRISHFIDILLAELQSDSDPRDIEKKKLWAQLQLLFMVETHLCWLIHSGMSYCMTNQPKSLRNQQLTGDAEMFFAWAHALVSYMRWQHRLYTTAISQITFPYGDVKQMCFLHVISCHWAVKADLKQLVPQCLSANRFNVGFFLLNNPDKQTRQTRVNHQLFRRGN